MLRKIISIGVAAGVVGLSGQAHAEGPGPAEELATGKVIVGLERVVSLFTYYSISATPNGSNTSTTGSLTSIGFLASDPGGVNNAFYVVPRLAVDVVVVPHLTLGGGAWIYAGLSQSVSSGGMSQDSPKPTYGGIAPRVGYILPVAESVAFWPRAGVEYHSLSNSTVTRTVGQSSITSGGTSLNQLAADIEANLVITPWSHVGFVIELYGAIPITGSVSLNTGSTTGGTTNTSENIAELVVGLTTGLVAYF